MASLIDSYYGLWGAWTERSGFGMWGEYISQTRAEIESEDPMGWALLPKFFPEYLTYEARIDPSLTGTFTMTFDSNKPYTHHSQYLLKARLVGTNKSNLTGNAQANVLTGNQADNILDGAAGDDTAVFQGKRSEYTVKDAGNGNVTVTDGTAGRDGSDTLMNIESVKFSDGTVSVSNLLGTTTSKLQSWREDHFPSDASNPALESSVWRNLADPDGDGVSNLVEYVFGSSPRREAGTNPVSNLRIESQAIRLTLNGVINDPSTSVVAQISGDLETWINADSTIHGDTEGADGRHTMEMSYPLTSNATVGFVRFLITQN